MTVKEITPAEVTEIRLPLNTFASEVCDMELLPEDASLQYWQNVGTAEQEYCNRVFTLIMDEYPNAKDVAVAVTDRYSPVAQDEDGNYDPDFMDIYYQIDNIESDVIAKYFPIIDWSEICQ